MSYGIFESAATDNLEQEARQRQALGALDMAILSVRDSQGGWVTAAETKEDFEDRIALVKDDMRKSVEAHLMPVTGVMRKVVKALRDDWFDAHKARTAAAINNAADVAAEFSSRVSNGELPSDIADRLRKDVQLFGNSATRHDVLDAIDEQLRKHTSKTSREYDHMAARTAAESTCSHCNGSGEEFFYDGDRTGDCSYCDGTGRDITSAIDDAEELIPEGNFDGYLDEVDDDAESKVDHLFHPADHAAARKQAEVTYTERPHAEGGGYLTCNACGANKEFVSERSMQDWKISHAQPGMFGCRTLNPEGYDRFGNRRKQAGVGDWNVSESEASFSYQLDSGAWLFCDVTKRGSTFEWVADSEDHGIERGDASNMDSAIGECETAATALIGSDPFMYASVKTAAGWLDSGEFANYADSELEQAFWDTEGGPDHQKVVNEYENRGIETPSDDEDDWDDEHEASVKESYDDFYDYGGPGHEDTSTPAADGWEQNYEASQQEWHNGRASIVFNEGLGAFYSRDAQGKEGGPYDSLEAAKSFTRTAALKAANDDVDNLEGYDDNSHEWKNSDGLTEEEAILKEFYPDEWAKRNSSKRKQAVQTGEVYMSGVAGGSNGKDSLMILEIMDGGNLLVENMTTGKELIVNESQLKERLGKRKQATGFATEEIEDMKNWAYQFGYISDTVLPTISSEDVLSIIKKDYPGGLIAWQQDGATQSPLDDVTMDMGMEPAPAADEVFASRDKTASDAQSLVDLCTRFDNGDQSVTVDQYDDALEQLEELASDGDSTASSYVNAY